jgi:hypothetical protein
MLAGHRHTIPFTGGCAAVFPAALSPRRISHRAVPQTSNTVVGGGRPQGPAGPQPESSVSRNRRLR